MPNRKLESDLSSLNEINFVPGLVSTSIFRQTTACSSSYLLARLGLTLSLFVFRINADNSNCAFSFNNFTLFANRFYR